MIEFPEFLSPFEADKLVGVGRQLGFQPEDELPKHVRDVKKIDRQDYIVSIQSACWWSLSPRFWVAWLAGP